MEVESKAGNASKADSASEKHYSSYIIIGWGFAMMRRFTRSAMVHGKLADISIETETA